ncbi:Pls/PosA family non-ribosomal peptide synthetase [Chryseobacterium sp. BIGb0232]|uniref:Pls/PosA family non-ribosomal peptide synthetase n=1 Tax=Chryseobacterium sp. BIGb0232 TaxID=2940598 RepID=UPI000F4610A4|nr:Pls/PosA family non-ribosomal peptide synthetase [Chryseobacterium sp. BIGb0232]MCS4301803.1 non-ribosomal peptide synthetase-like protein [Chryseobacterium sp. BIGb0232]ROS19345.1 non-ribosomal peptide synthetase-like protein [Chryseobacterium nakagawai]
MMKSLILGKISPEFIKDETLPELLVPTFEKYKDKTAFIFKNKKISYAELDSWSNAIALQLQNQGIQPGDSVGVWYPRSLELPIAILGILKAGAAYIPLDREMPVDRIRKVFTDIDVKAYFSDTDAHIHCEPLSIAAQPQKAVSTPIISQVPNHWAYVLFTSGSTGNPKGIPISHRNICHLIRSEQDFIGIKDTDTVYQGFSVSFDMWCEEVWISLFAGAAIWIADSTTVKAIDELSHILTENKITVLHAVPSILAIIDEVPAIRLINTGGEACTQQVQDKWAKPYRTFINSYGPTETTVSSNMIKLNSQEELTIGPPLPNYHIAIVDENMNILPRGERGEMIISGPGVSHGYFNLPELTEQKFLSNPFNELPGDKIYKTGDAVIIRENGFIDFQGRIDDQIKLRGYRIELGEIETRLNQLQDVSAAAVAVKEDSNGQGQLVGYAVMSNDTSFEESEMRKELSKFLAPYMVPISIVRMKEMPRMPSGKIDRKQLPLPENFTVHEKNDDIKIDLNAPVQERLLQTLKWVFPGKDINLEQDFFTDLGGHSLLAATLVSHLRQKAGIPMASLKEIYENRPLSAYSECLKSKQTQKASHHEPFHRVSTLQYIACNIAQTISLLVVFALLSIQIFFPYLSYYYFQLNGYGLHYALLSAFLLYTLIPPIYSLIILLTKWLVIGKIKEGDYPLWGWYYFRWWLWKTIKRLMPSEFIVETPLYPKYLKLLGVKVHPSAQLSLLPIAAEDLVTIDENVNTSSGCSIDNASVENGILRIRKVHIKAHSYLGSSVIICGDTVIEEFGELQDLSCLNEGGKIGFGEVWNGSPAEKVRIKTGEEVEVPKLSSAAKRNKYALLYSCSLFFFPLLIVLPLAPTLYTLYYLDDRSSDYSFYYLWQAPILSTVYILLFIAVVCILTRILQYKMKPGIYPVYSFTYYRKWIKDQIFNLSLIIVHPLFASIYITKFYRMMGTKVGKNSEISTASDVSHHLLEIGEGSFIADAVILGEHDVRNEKLILSKTKIGNNSFIGNSGLIPQGYELGDNMLIGVLSKAPSEEQLKNSSERDWFGSPPIGLPSRQKSEAFQDNLTYNPPFRLKLARAIVEGIRIILPQTIVIICSVLFIAYTSTYLEGRIHYLLLLAPFYYLGIVALPSFFLTVLLKWIFIGRYKESEMPMYSLKVWLSEGITTIYEALPVQFFLDFLRGTWWLPFFMRFLGVKIGKKVWLNTTDITEFDMVSIGDESMLNEDCGPQTHLFEDRIMKIGNVTIGSQTTINSRTIILYNTEIGNNVNIDALSLVMKGEVLSDNTSWYGSPLRGK